MDKPVPQKKRFFLLSCFLALALSFGMFPILGYATPPETEIVQSDDLPPPGDAEAEDFSLEPTEDIEEAADNDTEGTLSLSATMLNEEADSLEEAQEPATEIKVPAGNTLVITSPTEYYLEDGATTEKTAEGLYSASTRLEFSSEGHLSIKTEDAVVSRVLCKGNLLVDGGGLLTISNAPAGYQPLEAWMSLTLDAVEIVVDQTASYAPAVSSSRITLAPSAILTITSLGQSLSCSTLTIQGHLSAETISRGFSAVYLRESLVVDGGHLAITALDGKGLDAYTESVTFKNKATAEFKGAYSSGLSAAITAETIDISNSSLYIEGLYGINETGGGMTMSNNAVVEVKQNAANNDGVGINIQGNSFVLDNSYLTIGSAGSGLYTQGLTINGNHTYDATPESPATLSILNGTNVRIEADFYGLCGELASNHFMVDNNSTLYAYSARGNGIHAAGADGKLVVTNGSTVEGVGDYMGIGIYDGSILVSGLSSKVKGVSLRDDPEDNVGFGIYARYDLTITDSASVEAKAEGRHGYGAWIYETTSVSSGATLDASSITQYALDTGYLLVEKTAEVHALSKESSALSVAEELQITGNAVVTSLTEAEGYSALWAPGIVLVDQSMLDLYAPTWGEYHGALELDEHTTVTVQNDGLIRENYTVSQSFNHEEHALPFEGIMSFHDYDLYEFSVDSDGVIHKDASDEKQGIRSGSNGEDLTLTATRLGNNSDERIFLDDSSSHVVNTFPVVLTHAAAPTPTYTVTYHGNGSTGGNVPVDNSIYLDGDTVIVLAKPEDLVAKGMVFLGWDRLVNGEWKTYQAGDTFVVDESDTVLYAAWDFEWRILPPEPDPTKPDPADPTNPTDPAIPVTNPESRTTAVPGTQRAYPFNLGSGGFFFTPEVASPRTFSGEGLSNEGLREDTHSTQPDTNKSIADERDYDRSFKQTMNVHGWSLLSLIVVLLALAGTVLGLARILLQRKNNDEETAEEDAEAEESKTGNKKTYTLLAVASILGIIILVFFLIVENFTYVVFINRWTVPIIILFIAQIVLLILGRALFTKKEDANEEEDENVNESKNADEDEKEAAEKDQSAETVH